MKRRDRMTLELRPLHGGAYTQLSLCGPVCSSPQRQVMRQLVSALTHWNGWPMHVVLYVDAQTAGWCEVWAEALGGIPERHLQISFRIASDGNKSATPNQR